MKRSPLAGLLAIMAGAFVILYAINSLTTGAPAFGKSKVSQVKIPDTSYSYYRSDDTVRMLAAEAEVLVAGFQDYEKQLEKTADASWRSSAVTQLAIGIAIFCAGLYFLNEAKAREAYERQVLERLEAKAGEVPIPQEKPDDLSERIHMSFVKDER